MSHQAVPLVHQSVLLRSAQGSGVVPPNQAFKRTACKCRGSLKLCGKAAA